jgi:hypothetical protein
VLVPHHEPERGRVPTTDVCDRDVLVVVERLGKRTASFSSSALRPPYGRRAFVVWDRAVSAKGARKPAEPAARIRSEDTGAALTPPPSAVR